MSLPQHFLNNWLRLVERPMIARTSRPEALRRSIDIKSRLFFHAPPGTTQNWRILKAGQDHVPALFVVPRSVLTDRVIFYIHGGAFIFGSPQTHAAMAAQIAARTGARIVMPRYRLAPEAVFPAAFDDIHAAWDGLLATGIAADQVIIGGDSAGGALAFGLLGQLIAQEAALPMGVFGFSPLTDMALNSASVRENRHSDVLLPASRAPEMCKMYLGDCPADDPRASPVRADFTGAPPVWLTAGDTEILRDDARALERRLSDSGVEVTYEERHDLPHVWPLLHNFLPEARETLDHLAAWIRRQPGWSGES